MRDEARRRGLELLDEEAAILEDDSLDQERADVARLLAAFEAHGGHGAYRLEEWRRHAAEWVPLREVLSEILANTPDQYAQLIRDELDQVVGAEHPETVLFQRCGPLTRRAWELAERVVGVRPWAPNNYDGPLALPREVCEAVLADDRLLHAYDCSVCGYELPPCWAQRDAAGQFLGYLPCPVCGGRVGYCAWYETKRARAGPGSAR
jgi:hypothetical protein